ncbi:ABC transporter permease [Nocardiopsis aegyptia]|uniref:Putative ABC transport system permease protein n=1 Tax=Nocardiopsis aegyptia TaxID=220378 RepID=A0A7Z0ESQ7_9ACTN|nr:ABC transporter permease [Nocardiopsis aegyptia]NYJ37625.1 putative ABC transport system permease protein [Nocardiopsis aegyptia]
MLRTTLAGLRLHKSRYVTTVLAILLGVMFVSGTMVFADTLNANYEESVMGSATSVDAVAVPSAPEGTGDPAEEPAEPPRLTDDQLDHVRALPEVAGADGMVQGQAVLLDDEGRAFGYVPPAALALEEVTRFSPDEGSLPTDGTEIALATSTADQTGFGVGDTVTVLDADMEEHEFTVSGLVNFGVDPDFTYGGALVLDPGTIEGMTDTTGYAEIDVLAAEGYTDEQVAEAVAGVLGSDAEVSTGEEFGLAMAEGAGADTEMLRTALLLFAFIAMFVAGIVIYNTFAILIAQRQRELALLRCVGATRAQVFRSVLAESVVVGLVASALGVLAGVGIGMAGAAFGGPLMGMDAGVPVVLSPLAVLTGLVVGTVVTVCSALVPAMRATGVAPLAALRTSATAAGLEKGTGWVRVVFGLLAFAIAAVMVALTQLSGPDQTGPFVVTGAALVAFVGVVVLGPLIVRGCVRLVGLPMRRVGVASMLAVDNSTRSPRRAATAMIALTVGATLITGYSVVSASVESTMTRQLDENFPIDYQITPQFTMEGTSAPDADTGSDEGTAEDVDAPPEAEGTEGAEGAGGTDGTEDTAPESGEGSVPAADLNTVPDSVFEDLEAEPTVAVVSGRRNAFVETDDGRFLNVSTYPGFDVEDLGFESTAGDLADLGPGKVAVPEGQADGAGIGGTFALPLEDGTEVSLEVVALLDPMMTMGVLLDEQDFTEAFPELTGNDAVMVRGTDDADPAELREAVYDAVDDHPTLQVASMAEMRGQLSEMMDIAFYTIAAMLGLAILIAVFGISNTMALSVLERTRESALLRALGLTRGQLRRMLSLEAVLLCLIGAGVGIGLGVVFGWAAVGATLPDAILSVPGAQIAVFIVIAVLAGLLASVLPGRRAAGTSITGALASE